MGKDANSYANDYTHPKLREQLKAEIKESDRGAAPGLWSARKSQLLTQEYEKHGGGYRHPGQRTAAQHGLEEWSEQNWQTADGSGRARRDGETERYLPERAWEELSTRQREQTRRAKRAGSRQGRQFVANPPAARSARKAAELDELNAAEATKRARRLAGAEAEAALRHERDHKARKTVLRQLERAARR